MSRHSPFGRVLHELDVLVLDGHLFCLARGEATGKLQKMVHNRNAYNAQRGRIPRYETVASPGGLHVIRVR